MLLSLLTFPGMAGPEPLTQLGRHRVVYRRSIGDEGDGPESLAWDRAGQRLAVLLHNRLQTSDTILWIWPSGRRIKLPHLGGYRYIRWSNDGRQIAVGDDENVTVVDSSSGKPIQRRRDAVDATWVNGSWTFLQGSWPDIDYLPGTTGSGKIKKIGARLPVTVDSGAGSIALRVSENGFVSEYLPHQSRKHRWLAFGPQSFEIEQRPFTVALAGMILIAMPERSVDGFELYSYEKNSVRPYSFTNWRHLGRTSRAAGDEVRLRTFPVWIRGHAVAFGYLLGESAVRNNLHSVVFDFSARSMRDASEDVLSAAAQRGKTALVEVDGRQPIEDATLTIATLDGTSASRHPH